MVIGTKAEKVYGIIKKIEFPVCLGAAILSWRIGSRIAYAERGYDAIGGEAFLFPVVLFLTYWLFEKILLFVKKKIEEENRYRIYYHSYLKKRRKLN